MGDSKISATINDVAGLAGVSKTTVSHVLNETRFVADATKEKVLKAAKELNYQPSAVARSLKVKATKTLGMVVTSTLYPFYAEIVKEVEKYSYQQGYNLILCNTEGDVEKTHSYLHMLARKRADGVIIMCSTFDEELFSTIADQKKLPFVVMDWGPSVSGIDKIQDNSLEGGILATNHLIKLGHERIAHISGPLNILQAKQRQAGFRKAMANADREVRPDWIIESDFGCEGGHMAMMQLLAGNDRPTACFIANDMMAMGALSAAGELGFRIPDEISVVGYDNISISAFFNPPLTTIMQPFSELARLAVCTLLERLDHPRDKGKILMLEPTLVERSSTGILKRNDY